MLSALAMILYNYGGITYRACRSNWNYGSTQFAVPNVDNREVKHSLNDHIFQMYGDR